MTEILQPVYEPAIYELLPPAVQEQVRALARSEADGLDAELKKADQQKRIFAHEDYYFEAEEGRRRARMKRDEAELAGELGPDAEAFRDTRLRPRIQEAHEFEPVIRKPVVQGLFFHNSLAWVAGSSGTFKSFVTADLAFRYGSGDMDYHGRRMTSGRALLIVAEGAAGYADRKTAWECEHEREVKNVSIYPAPLQLADTIKEIPALLSYLQEEDAAGRPFGLIVFDTQAMCSVGVDESSSEMNLVVNVLHRIREVSGACVMVVHHFGKKAESGMRGSSMIYAAADTVCVLNRKDDEMDVRLSTSQADGGKQKDAISEKDLLVLTMESHEVGEDYFGIPVSALVPVVAAGGGYEVHEEAEDVALKLPALKPVDMYYLRGIETFKDDGASPSALRARLDEPERRETLPRPPHKVDRQTAGNRLQGLKPKHLTEPVPGAKGKWRITRLGRQVLDQADIARVQADSILLDRHARKGQYRGRSTAGLDHDQILGSPSGSGG